MSIISDILIFAVTSFLNGCNSLSISVARSRLQIGVQFSKMLALGRHCKRDVTVVLVAHTKDTLSSDARGGVHSGPLRLNVEFTLAVLQNNVDSDVGL